jgi:protein O-mannosyl-transferase
VNRRELTLWLTWGALLALTFVAYENMLTGEFTYDDKVEVVGNRTLRFLEEWRLVLAYNWSRPVLIATYALNYRLAGLDPWPYHVVDLTLQGLNAGLALLLGLRIFGDAPGARLAAAGSAALWAVHPLNTEAVSYVTGRSEQLAGGLMLLACLGFVSWRADGGLGRLTMCAVATALAFFTKEVAVVLPVAFFLLEWLVLRKGAPLARRLARVLRAAAQGVRGDHDGHARPAPAGRAALHPGRGDLAVCAARGGAGGAVGVP